MRSSRSSGGAAARRGRGLARIAAALLLLPAALAGQAAARRAEPDPDAAAIARARALVLENMERTRAPGASVAVSRGGRTVWSEAFGLADVELDAPATPKTKFRIGSVSKPLTSAALGLLVQEGRLDLDAPIQRYVPDFPVKKWPISARQLAGHLAGIRHYRGREFEIRDPYPDVRSALSIFAQDDLLFEPGTKYAYSSYGWNLLSAVIEGASGQPFLELMEKRIFAPLGMADTVPDRPAPIIPNRSRWYTRTESGPVENAGYVDVSYKWAGGGFLSTTGDLLRFAQAMLDATLLQPATVKLLWTPLKTADGKSTGYGLGWSVDRDARGRARVRHSGGAQGSTANLVLYPDQKLVIALLVNSDESFTGKAPEIAEEFLKGD